MRLLQLVGDDDIELVEYFDTGRPPYAILSHTWGPDDEEVLYKDITTGAAKSKVGYKKVLYTLKQAQMDGLQYAWIDSCSIDKSSSAELSEAINSMFQWYREAKTCYAYLSDVSVAAMGSRDPPLQNGWVDEFFKSRWFKRGWTLQELLAPKRVVFYSKEWQWLGDKTSLESSIQRITSIPHQALLGTASVNQFSIEERFRWARDRQTKRQEDKGYCMLGIFDVSMPLIYGEGQKKAMRRLRREAQSELEDELSGHGIPFSPQARMATAPSAVVCDNVIRCFFRSSSSNTGIIQQTFDGSSWSAEDRVPISTVITGAPSAVYYNERIFCFFQDQEKYGKLYYRVLKASESGVMRLEYASSRMGHLSPGQNREVPRTLSSSKTSPVVYGNKLWLFHQGNGKNGELRYVSCEGKKWLGNHIIENVKIRGGPSAVVYGGFIYCFFASFGQSSDLGYCIYDGKTFSQPYWLPNSKISGSPSAVVYEDKLYCFHQGARKNGELWYNVFDGDNWDGDLRVPYTGLSKSPSAVVLNGLIFCFHRDAAKRQRLQYSVFDGKHWIEPE